MSPPQTTARARPVHRRGRHPAARGGAALAAAPGTVRASGELDLATVPDLRARLLAAVERHSAGVVVDLSRVTFADCRAVAALVAARNRARELGRPLPVLRGTPPRVAQLLRATGTHSLFPHYA